MDIHRCRFVSYPPSTINVLAFSQSQGREQRALNLRLALGRANGDIEIWNPLNGAWLQETILRGGKDRSVDGLVWIQDPDEEDEDGQIIPGKLRLFSIGYTTTVTEWDLETSQILRQTSGNHGEIWCLAAQPSILKGQKQATGHSTSTQWQGQYLVAGCTDGAVVLYSTADQDLKLERVLARPSAKKAKVISINFQDRNIIVAGCTNGTIRIYDIRNGTLVRSMSLGGGIQGGPKEIIVWAVKCLPNGNIISGDSTGEVRIWDGKTYTLLQRIKSHRQDVLSLATSNDGSTILSGGMDRRTVIYKQAGERSRWGVVSHRRFHNHDVKTMAAFEGNEMSVVVSGGPDASPIVMPLQKFGLENQRSLPFLPQEPIVQSAPRKGLILSWWDREIHIWRISRLQASQGEHSEFDVESDKRSRNRRLVAKILIKGEANINSATISTDGSLLCLSTSAEIKVFRLMPGKSEDDALRVSMLEIPRNVSAGGARIVHFSPDGRWLCVVRRNNRIAIIRVIWNEMAHLKPRLLPTISNLKRLDRKLERRESLGGLGKYNRTVTRVSFSSDSRILAASDLAGYVDTWVVEGQENIGQDRQYTAINDASSSPILDESSSEDDDKKPTVILGQHWTRNPSATLLPKLPSTPVVLSFRPSIVTSRKAKTRDLPREDRLLIVTATSQVFEFEVLRGGLTLWSRRNPIANFPDEFKGIRDLAMGCIWDMSVTKERVWLYGSSWLWMYDLSRDLPYRTPPRLRLLGQGAAPNGEADPRGFGRKRRRDHEHGDKMNGVRKNGSGAGSRVPDSRLGSGMSRKIQRISHDDVKQTTNYWRQRHEVESSGEDSDRDMHATNGFGATLNGTRGQGEALTLQSRQTRGLAGNGEGGNKQHGSSIDEGDDGGDGGVGGRPHWWHTYKYRPIMGIVPLGAVGQRGLEVAVVERPIWEVDLPPRYYGDQEWDQLV